MSAHGPKPDAQDHVGFSIPCALGLHDWSRWSRPYNEKTIVTDARGLVVGEGLTEVQDRTCMCCGIYKWRETTE